MLIVYLLPHGGSIESFHMPAGSPAASRAGCRRSASSGRTGSTARPGPGRRAWPNRGRARRSAAARRRCGRGRCLRGGTAGGSRDVAVAQRGRSHGRRPWRSRRGERRRVAAGRRTAGRLVAIASSRTTESAPATSIDPSPADTRAGRGDADARLEVECSWDRDSLAVLARPSPLTPRSTSVSSPSQVAVARCGVRYDSLNATRPGGRPTRGRRSRRRPR
jgi:hypothetical protein